jgi:hypothetical protein
MSRMTRAQRKFLTELNAGICFPTSVLTGPEMAMARRLEEAKLVVLTQVYRETYFDITREGRAAIALPSAPASGRDTP